MVVMDKSLGEDRKMCPKHGIAHGVCVDPIKAEVPPDAQPAEDFPGIAMTSCTFCGETAITFPHTCDINKVPDLTNRFDPYETLDAIEGAVSSLGFTRGHSLGDRIISHVFALRAYITGMER
ncbi:hypothetical protein LCGC14_2397430 [marine sediment metagenome]|uniref:Uncharacterized protein n=1 Tax=marine sediment metagenome TaxID=412755 RepID=A0A0F9CIG5_9ZZZZ